MLNAKPPPKGQKNNVLDLRPEVKGVCKLHGGTSTGPKTELDQRRCAQVKTVRGDETKIKHSERGKASARLAVLEMIGHSLGFMHGPQTRGRKPDQMMHAYPRTSNALPRADRKTNKTW